VYDEPMASIVTVSPDPGIGVGFQSFAVTHAPLMAFFQTIAVI
jgi:hypothetical protein